MTLPTYTETSRRAWSQRSTANALTRARDAAADAACASTLAMDLKAGGLVFAAAFVFLLALGVM